MTVNFNRNSCESLKEYGITFGQRFKEFLLKETLKMASNIEEYVNSKEIHVLQEIYELSKEYPGIQFGFIQDNRQDKIIFGHWITKKNSAL